MKNLCLRLLYHLLSVEDILKRYDFSPRFLGLYGVACARSVMDLTKDPDKTKEWLDIAEGYWLGKRTEEELERVRKVAVDGNYRITNAAYHADYASYSAYYVIYYTTDYTGNAASVVAQAAREAKRKDVCKDILLDMISNMTRLEKELL